LRNRRLRWARLLGEWHGMARSESFYVESYRISVTGSGMGMHGVSGSINQVNQVVSGWDGHGARDVIMVLFVACGTLQMVGGGITVQDPNISNPLAT